MKHIRSKKLAVRSRIKRLGANRLSVHRTSGHIYAQVTSPDGKVLAAISSLSPDFKKLKLYGGNVEAAKKIGELIAKLAKKSGVTKVAFDRAGKKFHGRIAALAAAAREAGLEF